MQEITFDQFPLIDRIASYRFAGNFSSAVLKRKDGYCIRIITGAGFSRTNISRSWDYFDLDETGMITKSPRGMAKDFNKKVRITDMDQAVEKYKETVVNQ